MAAVFAPAQRVAEALDAHNANTRGIGVCIGADNGAQQVISGPAAEIAAVLESFEAAGVRVARLRKSPAYHSAMIEPAMDDLEAGLSELAFAPPSLPFVSNLDGRTLGSGAMPDAAYWRRQMRAPVAFRACVETLAELGVDAVVEIGPHAVVGPMIALAWPATGGVPEPAVVSSLRRPSRGEEQPAPGSGGRLRGGGRRCLRGGVGAPLRRSVRRRGTAPDRAAGLSFPTRAVLGSRRPDGAGREPDTRCWVCGTTPRAARSVSIPRCSLRTRRGSATTACSIGWSCRARSTAPWPYPPAGPRATGDADIEDFQMLSALVLSENDAADGSGGDRQPPAGAAGRSRRGPVSRRADPEQGRARQQMDVARGRPNLDRPRFRCAP